MKLSSINGASSIDIALVTSVFTKLRTFTRTHQWNHRSPCRVVCSTSAAAWAGVAAPHVSFPRRLRGSVYILSSSTLSLVISPRRLATVSRSVWSWWAELSALSQDSVIWVSFLSSWAWSLSTLPLSHSSSLEQGRSERLWGSEHRPFLLGREQSSKYETNKKRSNK